jgi:hypothetical protein
MRLHAETHPIETKRLSHGLPVLVFELQDHDTPPVLILEPSRCFDQRIVVAIAVITSLRRYILERYSPALSKKLLRA